ncbi:hypothetical protein [Streptosporangium canum]|uniref:hypothetical protein n=1 Tax=Streptosporangium canum TaxID=324952 RepID=UPI003798B0C0
MTGKTLGDDGLLDRDRIIALLILLYALPVGRIVRLTVEDVARDGDRVLINLGDQPSPVPEPFADCWSATSTPSRTPPPRPTATAVGCSLAAVLDRPCTRPRSTNA